MIKLVAIDMNGTLLDSQKRISAANRQAVKDCVSQGITIVLSTGRPFRFAETYADSLGLDSYYVTANGGEIFNPQKEIIAQHLIDPDEIKWLADLSESVESDYWILSTDDFYVNSLPDDHESMRWLKFGFKPGSVDETNKVRKLLEGNEAFEVSNTLLTNIEINPAGINKAYGIKMVCRQLGIQMDEVMAIGDALNDLMLIREAGVGVAMGNAQDPVKLAANKVTATNDQDGVAKALIPLLDQ